MNPLLAVTRISLEDMDNLTVASANNAISGFGSISRGNRAYVPFLEARLIDDNGRPKDHQTLRDALTLDIQRRLDAGTWN